MVLYCMTHPGLILSFFLLFYFFSSVHLLFCFRLDFLIVFHWKLLCALVYLFLIVFCCFSLHNSSRKGSYGLQYGKPMYPYELSILYGNFFVTAYLPWPLYIAEALIVMTLAPYVMLKKRLLHIYFSFVAFLELVGLVQILVCIFLISPLCLFSLG